MPNPIARFKSFIKRKTSQKYRFNMQYEQKKWEGMRDVADEGRYNFITGYIRKNFARGRILDLGSGEGILLERLMEADYSYYLGVDFSEVAIQNAQKLKSDKASFIVGDLNKLSVAGTFDVIIYNETLYYLRNPKQATQSVFKNLAAGGVLIFSMVDKHGKERTALWAQLDEILTTVEKTKITNAAGDSWTVKIYKLRS